MEETLTVTSYTAQNMVQGSTYKFKVEVRNLYGYSAFSNTVTILAAQTPHKPEPPVTTWVPDDVVITWVAPNSGGAPILGYTVVIIQSDGVSYAGEPYHCNMINNPDTTCTIPVETLRIAPFNLDWGTSVFVKVTATNLHGDSLQSDAGNGAVITINPDPPTDVIEVYEQRSKSTIGITWTPPLFTGGAVIEDYRINMAVQG